MHVYDTIGRLFMVGIPHPALDDKTRQLLHKLRPGGVILYRRNYRDPETLAALCTEIHSLFSDYTLLVALDHEGGRVHRLAPPFTHFPPAAILGRISSAALVQRVGQAMGQELSSIGIDIDFAPVLDVLTNPRNRVIGDRAFSADPHVSPFRQVIAEQVEMIMTAHILYPALDSNLPATLSPLILDELLRRRLNFQGVIVTDDLEMGAIVRHFTVEQAAVDALRAGADLLLICHSLERAVAARDACARALSDGTLFPQRVEQAGQRIEALRQTRYHPRRMTTVAIGAPEHQRLVEEILQQAG